MSVKDTWVNGETVNASDLNSVGSAVNALQTGTQPLDADLTALAALTAPATKLSGIEALADVTDAANVDAAGAVMNTDTSTASMSFVVDEDAMTSNSDTKVPTQQSVKAYVLANAGGGGGTAAQEPTYIISITGSTITATPRAGSGFSTYTGATSGSGPYTVIQNAINALTPSGAAGSGGGKIKICAGTYFLSNELTVVGWEGIVASNSQPQSQLIIEGDGMATYLVQTTSAKNGIKFNNCACLVLRDMKIYAGSSSKSCILGDNDGATSVMSGWKCVIDNVHCHSDSTTAPAVLIKDFFDFSIPWLRAYCTGNSGVVLQQTDTIVKRGNSWIGSLVSASSASSPHAGLKLECTTSSSVIDMVTIDNFQCTTPSYYGIYLYGAQYNNFLFTDIESAFYCVYADGPASGSYQYSSNNNFYAGYWQPADNGTGYHGTTHAFATTIDGVAIYTRGDGSVKAINDLNTGNASDYKISMPNYAAPDLAANSIGYSGTRLQIIAPGTAYTEKIPSAQIGTIELGHASDTTLCRSAAGKLAVEGVVVPTVSSTETQTNKTFTSPTLVTPALGTPASGNLANCTGIPLPTASTSNVLGVGTIELGNASDTTLARSSAGRISVEGKVLALDFATTFADVNMNGSPAQTVSAGAWTKLNMNSETSDAGSNYDAVTNFTYTCPTAGIYEFFAMVRIMDGTTTDMNLGIGIHTSAIDGVWVSWIPVKTSASASRAAYQYLRKVNATAGQSYQLVVYCDAGASVGIKSAQMTAIRIT